jgi:hypothetical protein
MALEHRYGKVLLEQLTWKLANAPHHSVRRRKTKSRHNTQLNQVQCAARSTPGACNLSLLEIHESGQHISWDHVSASSAAMWRLIYNRTDGFVCWTLPDVNELRDMIPLVCGWKGGVPGGVPGGQTHLIFYNYILVSSKCLGVTWEQISIPGRGRHVSRHVHSWRYVCLCMWLWLRLCLWAWVCG